MTDHEKEFYIYQIIQYLKDAMRSWVDSLPGYISLREDMYIIYPFDAGSIFVQEYNYFGYYEYGEYFGCDTFEKFSETLDAYLSAMIISCNSDCLNPPAR
jgi:hypothetical protein